MANELSITLVKLKQPKQLDNSNVIYELIIGGQRENNYIVVSKESHFSVTKKDKIMCLNLFFYKTLPFCAQSYMSLHYYCLILQTFLNEKLYDRSNMSR